MKSKIIPPDQSFIGLGVLSLLAVALIASLAQAPASATDGSIAALPAESAAPVEQALMPAVSSVSGAVRELKVRSIADDLSPQLGWVSDAVLLEKHRNAGPQ